MSRTGTGRRGTHLRRRSDSVVGRTQVLVVSFGTWSTWSAVGSLTSRAGELRSAPSGPDDRDRVTGKRALAPGVRVRRAITRVSEG